MLSLFVTALAIGVSIAAPVGPIGLLCIQRSLAHGLVIGFVSGLGAAAADGVYGAIAAFGLTALSNALIAHALWVQLGGGVILVALGVQAARGTPRMIDSATETARGGLAAFASIFVLTLANPMTILSFVAVFAGLGLVAAETTAAALVVVAGVFLGSAAWWLALAGGVSLLRARIGPRVLVAINRAAGAFIAGVGLWAVVTALRS